MFPESRLGTRFCGGPGVASWGLPEVPWGPLETSWEFPGASRGFLRASGRPLGAWGPFGASGDFLGAPWGLTGLHGSLWKAFGSRVGASIEPETSECWFAFPLWAPSWAVRRALPEVSWKTSCATRNVHVPRRASGNMICQESGGGPHEASGGSLRGWLSFCGTCDGRRRSRQGFLGASGCAPRAA